MAPAAGGRTRRALPGGMAAARPRAGSAWRPREGGLQARSSRRAPQPAHRPWLDEAATAPEGLGRSLRPPARHRPWLPQGAEAAARSLRARSGRARCAGALSARGCGPRRHRRASGRGERGGCQVLERPAARQRTWQRMAAVAAGRGGGAGTRRRARRRRHRRGLRAGPRVVSWHAGRCFTLLRVLPKPGRTKPTARAPSRAPSASRCPMRRTRARLRVEIGRLRRVAAHATVEASARAGSWLQAHGARSRCWRRRSKAGGRAAGAAGRRLVHLGAGARARCQPARCSVRWSNLTAGHVRAVRAGAYRRWLAPPLVGITTILLLPARAAVWLDWRHALHRGDPKELHDER